MHGLPVYSAILLHLSILIIPALGALAQAPNAGIPEDINKSVLLLHSKTSPVCATGFLLSDGTLVTNAHVTRTLCPGGSCEGIQLLRAPKIGAAPDEALPISTASILREVPVLDVSFLKLEGRDLPKGFFSSVSPAQSGQEIYSLGFPKCGNLTLSLGSIREVDGIRVSTSTRGAHGSSGSPMFTSDGKLVAVAMESDSLSGGLLSMFTDYTFDTVALRADVALNLRALSEDDVLLEQADTLLANYRNDIRTIEGVERIRPSLSFIAAVDGLRDAMLFTPGRDQELRAMAALGQYLDYLPRLLPAAQPSPLVQRLESLVLAYNLELKGAQFDFMIPARTDILFESLNRPAVPSGMRDEFKELITFAVRDGYKGLEVYGLLLGLQIVVIAAAILGILAWSMGYVFAGARGGLFKRLICSCSNLLIWPLPVIIVWWKRRRTAA